MDGKNYMKISKFSLKHIFFCYVDTNEYLADRIFIRRKINVRCEAEYGNDKNDYVVVFCKIRKNDREEFIDAMEELKEKMLILEHRDYMELCSRLQIKKKEKGKKVC